MKKTITSLVLALASLCAMAQTDVTSKYIKNASFEDGATNWTVAGLVKQTNSSFTKKSGSAYMEKWVGKGSKVGNASASQSLSNLPAGEYIFKMAAQNLDQNSTSKKCTGARIFAGTDETTVYTPNDYEVAFKVITGKADIGFEAVDATGNWLAIDNARLYLVKEYTKAEVADVLHVLADSAKTYLDQRISTTVVKAINSAADKCYAITEASTSTAVTTAYNAIIKAITDAKASIQAYNDIDENLVKAEALLDQMMSAEALNALNGYIEKAKAVTTETNSTMVNLALKNLLKGITAAETSVAEYKALNTAITKVEKSYVETKNGADKFLAIINAAKALAVNADAKSEELSQMIEDLNRAQLEFNLANATHGTGTAVKVTMTNPYVATGATEALMRATMTGSNILEKGVCWSTEHEPTVLDSRTTEYHELNGYIYHVRGLKVATVYYLRPYVMNKTYEVAYGDEVKIVTHPKGTCTGSWDEGAPDDAANTRCRNAINETIEYFNQWTGIRGFNLSGHYGAGTPTADCSYGGWMRIGPNAGNQAIGTVIHETGHGVGVGTSDRWWDTNVHDWKWYGREANKMYSFLEGKTADPWNSEFCMVGDKTHGWGSSAAYDWFVNGADKDKHIEYQYLGGCCLLYGLFVDGLCPTSGYSNGISSYTYNFDDAKVYYLRSEAADRGLNDGYVYEKEDGSIAWRTMTDEEVAAEESNAAWYLEYDANACFYRFRNATTGHYLTHSTANVSAIEKAKPSTDENFQLMPGRPDVTVKVNGKNKKTYGYWFTWNSGGNKAMRLNAANASTGIGTATTAGFDYANSATSQRYIILSADELGIENTFTGIESAKKNAEKEKTVEAIYSTSGVKQQGLRGGINIVRYSDGTSKKIYIK